jgi:hypothetical protein
MLVHYARHKSTLPAKSCSDFKIFIPLIGFSSALSFYFYLYQTEASSSGFNLEVSKIKFKAQAKIQ